MKHIKIGDNIVGRGYPCFIIAEAGVNHNGNPEKAIQLVKAAAGAGADAVKFQTLTAEGLCSRCSPYFDLFRPLELDRKAWEEIAAAARELGIIFISTPFDEESVDLLDELGVPAFKIASGDLTHLPLIEYIAEKNKPIILATGIATIEEIDEALAAIHGTGNEDVALLHCVSSYPAPVEDMNLRSINTLEDRYDVPVGLSDHSMGSLVPVTAVALGAALIEKHFTLDSSLDVPDKELSLDPAEFKEMVRKIRTVEQALGNGIKKPSQSELEIRDAARRSIVAKRDIPKGTTISADMIKIVRPGTGIAPKDLKKVIGSIARHDIPAEEPLTRDEV
jgi:N,N'-diacetyllegionaminate synthase